VDARLLGIGLEHLLENAVRHTPEGTPIRVALGTADGRRRLTVEDDGPGVPAEMLPHLFDRFYRNDPARGRHSGAGLGLTTVAIIADLHHGRVSAGPGSRGGLRVTLDLLPA
jgi:signal transduction histidine kinase